MLSMTAFARESIPLERLLIVCELRSVNHRYLDLNLRLPEFIRHLEPELRAMIKSRIARGKVDCQFEVKIEASCEAQLTINTQLVQNLDLARQQIDEIIQGETAQDAFQLLAWPGVLQEPSINPELIEKNALPLLNKTLGVFLDSRQREGDALKTVILEKLAAIEQTVQQVADKIPNIIAAQRLKLENRCTELLAEVDQSRLEQELLHFCQKMDVAEEIDRLRAHLIEVKKHLLAGGIIGRRLDFLMQELNREANTLSSKSVDSQTSQAAVEIKVLIEQMREQAQNIE